MREILAMRRERLQQQRQIVVLAGALREEGRRIKAERIADAHHARGPGAVRGRHPAGSERKAGAKHAGQQRIENGQRQIHAGGAQEETTIESRCIQRHSERSSCNECYILPKASIDCTIHLLFACGALVQDVRTSTLNNSPNV